MGMRLLSDFDGVWTNQAEEARAVRAGFVREVARRLGEPEDDLQGDFDAFLAAARAEPWDNGWAPGGEVTAFVDEDPLLETASVASWLDRGGVHPRADRWRRGLGTQVQGGVCALANACFGPSTLAHREHGGHGLVPGARDALEALRSAGVDVVLVSNSHASKLEALLTAARIDPARDVRVIGDARKWQLGDGRDLSEIGARYVRLDRPHYRAVLAAEQPDLVVGDVLSLDLALPAMLRAVGVLPAHLALALRRHTHTPAWTLDAHRGGVFDHLIDDVRELPALVRALPR